jgi:hypothetical protein
MGGGGASEDLRGVVVARDQSVVIDVEILHPIVGVDFGWERDEKSATWCSSSDDSDAPLINLAID